jgi:methylglyoxal synthase
VNITENPPATLDHNVQRMPARRRIALIAHDHKKADMRAWAHFNKAALSKHTLVATGTTGKMIETEVGLPVTCVKSGPLGGDLQIGAQISEGEIDLLVFFWDPLEPQPHDPDVKAVLRVAVVYNVPIACNRASADFIISSPLMTQHYDRLEPDYSDHVQRSAG